MKKLVGWLSVLALLLSQAGGAFAQVSDYEIIEKYKKSHQSTLESLKSASNVEQLVTLENDIGLLEADYGQHRKLLGEGLYPESFEVSIATLRDQLQKASERIRLAEESKKDKAKIVEVSLKAEAADKKIVQISRENEEYRASVQKLTAEVNDLTARVKQLSEENTGLLEKIQALQAEGRKDKASIAKLQALTEKLNANIRDRDELIMRMMSSLVAEYSKAGLTDTQKKDLFLNVRGNDYVGKLITTIDENVKYSQSTLPGPQDAMLLREEQRKLSTQWEEIKPYLGNLYQDEQTRTRDLATVDSRLADWRRSAGEAMWKSIQQVFAGQNIAIGQLRNAGEFSAQLLAYVDLQLQNPSRETYKTFKKVWDSPMKDTWLPVIPIEELSQQQRNDIEARIALWEKKISALLWRWVALGAIGIALLGAILAIVLRRNKPGPPISEDKTAPVKYPTG